MSDYYPVESTDVNTSTSNLTVYETANIATATVTDLTVVNPPTIPDVIFDSTDVTLSTDKIMISNGTHEIKQSTVDINDPVFNSLTCSSLTLTGNTYPKEIGGYINLSVSHPTGLSGIRITVPSYVTYLKEIRSTCTLSGANGTANLKVYDALGNLLITMSTSTNSTQLLFANGSFSLVGSNWVELTVDWTGGTVGTFTIASHTMAFV